MFDGIGSLITGLFSGLDTRRRWFVIVSLLALALVAMLTYEYFYANAYYSKLQRKVALLREMHSLAKDGATTNPQLAVVYQQTLDEIARYRVYPLPELSLSATDPVTIIKWLGGAALCLIIGFVGLSGSFGQQYRVAIAIVLFFMAVPLGFLGTVIPTIGSPWVNLVGFPMLQLAFLAVVSKKKQPSRT